MADDSKNPDQGFVIKDRRRFDSDGNEKAEEAESKKSAPAGKAAARPVAERGDSPEPEAKGFEIPEISFSSFVMSLATQALMQLGELKPPPGMQIDVDKAAAKQTIDILGMLEFKTRNNLDPEEKHLLDEILHNLRLSYVKA